MTTKARVATAPTTLWRIHPKARQHALAHRSQMSPGYQRTTRGNSPSVSPRPSTRIERSSARSRKARRSLRLSSLRRAARSVASRVLWSIGQFWVLSPRGMRQTLPLASNDYPCRSWEPRSSDARLSSTR